MIENKGSCNFFFFLSTIITKSVGNVNTTRKFISGKTVLDIFTVAVDDEGSIATL